MSDAAAFHAIQAIRQEAALERDQEVRRAREREERDAAFEHDRGTKARARQEAQETSRRELLERRRHSLHDRARQSAQSRREREEKLADAAEFRLARKVVRDRADGKAKEEAANQIASYARQSDGERSIQSGRCDAERRDRLAWRRTGVEEQRLVKSCRALAEREALDAKWDEHRAVTEWADEERHELQVQAVIRRGVGRVPSPSSGGGGRRRRRSKSASAGRSAAAATGFSSGSVSRRARLNEQAVFADTTENDASSPTHSGYSLLGSTMQASSSSPFSAVSPPPLLSARSPQFVRSLAASFGRERNVAQAAWEREESRRDSERDEFRHKRSLAAEAAERDQVAAAEGYEAWSTAKAKAEKEHSVWLARRRQDSRDRAHASKAVREERQQADAARLAVEIEDHRVQHDEREQYALEMAEQERERKAEGIRERAREVAHQREQARRRKSELAEREQATAQAIANERRAVEEDLRRLRASSLTARRPTGAGSSRSRSLTARTSLRKAEGARGHGSGGGGGVTVSSGATFDSNGLNLSASTAGPSIAGLALATVGGQFSSPSSPKARIHTIVDEHGLEQPVTPPPHLLRPQRVPSPDKRSNEPADVFDREQRQQRGVMANSGRSSAGTAMAKSKSSARPSASRIPIPAGPAAAAPKRTQKGVVATAKPRRAGDVVENVALRHAADQAAADAEAVANVTPRGRLMSGTGRRRHDERKSGFHPPPRRPDVPKWQ